MAKAWLRWADPGAVGNGRADISNGLAFFIEKAVPSRQAVWMSESVLKPMAAPRHPLGLKLWQFIVVKSLLMIVFVAVLAAVQGWAAKSSYSAENTAGFKMGLVHGMLMPAAFPALVAGHDVPIYAPNNSGRNYKIGYILGINACGTVFFALAYWGVPKPGRKKAWQP